MASKASSDHASFASSSDDSSDSGYDTNGENNHDEIPVIYSYLDDLLQDTSREVGTSSDALYSTTTGGAAFGASGSTSDSLSIGMKYKYHSSQEASDEKFDDDDDDDEDLAGADVAAIATVGGSIRLDNNREEMMRTGAKHSSRSMYSSILMTNSTTSERHLSTSEHENGAAGFGDDQIEDEKQHIEQDMKAIEHYLEQHHQLRQARKKSTTNSTSDRVRKINANTSGDGNDDDYDDSDLFHHEPALLDDHQLYYYTNSANPIAIKQTFLYSIQTDDTELLQKLLRDVGIEYLLRHCMRYHGLLEENIHVTSHATSPSSSKNIGGTQSRGDNGKDTTANIFWLAALHGSAKVLEILLEVTWIHFAESSYINLQMASNDEGNKEMKTKEDQSNLKNNECGNSENDFDIENLCKNEIKNYLNDSALSYGTSPMYVAAAQNHKDVISLLLRYGVDPNKPNDEQHGKSTPAIIAASRNHTDALDALSQCGTIDFNIRNEYKITPLLAACQHGCIDSVRFLTNFTIPDDNGFDIPVVDTQCQNTDGYGCASIAAQHNQQDVIIYLCQIHDPINTGIDVNQRNPEGDTVIHVATKYNKQSVVKALLEMIPRSCNITQINRYGMNALHIAASHGHINIVKEFMQCLPIETIHEFDVEDLYGMTPIFYATLKGHHEIVNALASVSNINRLLRVQLTKKKNRRKGNDNDKQKRKKKIYTHQTPLHAAAMHGFVNIVYTLLICGAEVDKVDSGGHTALSLAAKMGNLEVVRILIEHGADAKIKSKRGKTPLAKAKRYKRKEIVEYLEQLHVK